MYLLDSNILLELFLDQAQADRVEQFLRTTPRERLHISEFSLYSVGIVLFRRKLFKAFERFLDDLIIRGGVRLLRLSAEDLGDLVAVAQRFQLDFDDAYQYAIAEQHDLTIVSFDADFDRTEKGRQPPGALVS